ncbi:hypothetical protein [Stackebrandtia nassauensis]|uniref:Uncharacterized protein n=1 Tax=Stackebrandtia nassauensis (strain DSM 44728 / CIP 108903 / NRRL B-16338 / NBRC 102104 / LLR-40K-21) TaxID=446470 RepID=D3PXQ7_STANL|nr:hypothetical protein [Stackebrandtia nassauensis]ADD43387.1 conserved hypothetical protein [Stackebrandtia nassauensis DSM 44728]
MNWADDSDSPTGDEAYPEPDPGMDDAAYDESTGDDEVSDFDAEDDTLDPDAEVSEDGDEPVASDEGAEGDADAEAADEGEQPAPDGPDADADVEDEPEPAGGDEPETDPDAEAIEITDDEVVGTDPDADLAADDPAFDAEFPPDIDMDARPEPVDGEPWSDASLLGSTSDAGTDWAAYDYSAPPMDDLFAMDGASSGSWDSLAASDDPAVSSLARWWQPT